MDFNSVKYQKGSSEESKELRHKHHELQQMRRLVRRSLDLYTPCRFQRRQTQVMAPLLQQWRLQLQLEPPE